jgi:peptidoglycan hydrolase CwlO-like protein
MLEINPDSVIQVLGMVALAVIVVFVGVQKLLKDWKSTNAETSIITLMHTELDRMSEQNTQLSVELGRLNAQVITLNQQLQKLTIENQRLQSEVVALTREVARLQSVLHKGDPNGSTN